MSSCIDRLRRHRQSVEQDREAANALEARQQKEAAETAEKATRRAAATERQKKSRAAQMARLDFICRHCTESGHDPESRQSCTNFCHHCCVVDHPSKGCPVKAKEDFHRRCINLDAANYKRAIDETMVFYTCAICEAEHGLIHMVPLEDVADKIAESDIKRLFDEMVAPLGDPNADRCMKAFARAVSVEMLDGLLVGAEHVCRQCFNELSEKKGVRTTPKRALVNGYFRGKIPMELAVLNRTEMSLVSLTNVQTTLAMLPQHSHWGSRATAFSVMNDVVEIAEKLPRLPSVAQTAIIRTETSSTPKDFRFNPHRVLAAMVWLQNNNYLYESVLQLPLLPDGSTHPSWVNGGVNADIEPPYIPAEACDYEGVDDPGVAPSGEDGHPVNPGAPSSDTTDVFLQSAPEDQNHIQQLAAVISDRVQPTVVFVRKRGQFVSDYDTEHFLAKAFPQLFPYGKGCPNIIGSFSFDAAYIQHTLQLGRYRSFQQCPSYVFYAYTWWIRKKVGTVSFLVEKSGDRDDAVLTVADAQRFLSALSTEAPSQVEDYMESKHIRYLLDRMKPYANELPGTEMYFARERKKLMSMISSPVTTSEGQWAWFFTEAQPDLYQSEIYDNAISSAFGMEADLPPLAWNATPDERQARVDSLTAQQRATILRDHPFMSARIHALQQAAYWTHILRGEDKPLGEIIDFWCRVEFQMKGTPHWHCLINVSKESLQGITANSVLSDDVAERQKVKNLVARVSTASLLSRDSGDTSELPDNGTRAQIQIDEKEWAYNIDRPRYMRDAGHPSRHRFQASGRDYFMTDAGHIQDMYVRQLYRRLQFANQFHRCRESCWKYCKKGSPKVCRFEFPRIPLPRITEEVVIVTDKDRRNRCRVKVHPQRNNGNMNVHLRSPLCFLSGRGNQDIQYIHNTVGGAEYVSKYCSKAEKTESSTLQNAINRKLAEYAIRSNSDTGVNMSFRQKLRAIGNAVVGAQQIGAVQACYVLGKIPLIRSSRTTLSINTLRRKDLTLRTVVTDENDLADMNENDSALLHSPSTTLGKRDAYHALCMQQIAAYDSMEVTFFAFLSSYQVKVAPAKGYATARKDPIHLRVNEHGFVVEPHTFIMGEILYAAMERPAVLCMTPHIPVDESDERSAFSILLLYGKWPSEGENHLAVPNAVTALALMRESLPPYVTTSLHKQRMSEQLIANVGEPTHGSEALEEAHADATDNEEWNAPENSGHLTGVTAAPFLHNTERFTYNAGLPRVQHCVDFIKDLKESMSAERRPRAYTLTQEEKARRAADPSLYIELHDCDAKRAKLGDLATGLNVEQRRAYDSTADHINGTSGKQMIMFVSGEGGTGKSRLIHAVTLYAQIHVGKTEGSWGPVLKAAPTGGAAYNIGGSTWHSALGRGGMVKLKINDPVPDASVVALQRKAKGTTLFVLDELSLVSCEDLFEISRRLQAATGNATALFGGLHVLLAGDFYQMKTINGTPLVALVTGNYTAEARMGRSIITSALTDFCMLLHNVRAQQGGNELTPLAKFTRHARIGDVHNGLLHLLNDRVVNNVEQAMRMAHSNALWITSTHDKVSEINEQFRLKRLANNEHMVTVISRHTSDQVRTPAPNTPEILDQLYGKAGSRKGGRSDLMVSYMNLFVGSRVRLIRNLFVEGGLYNGAMGTVWGFVYKGSGPQNRPGEKIKFCDMSELEREIPVVLVQMDGDDSMYPYTCIPGVPRVVPIVEVQSQQLVEARIMIKEAVYSGSELVTSVVYETFQYRRHQLPILPAEARTAHSVQGYTAKDGVVVDPGSKFFAGDYTGISRATCKEKVLLLAPLQEKYFTQDPGYRRLVEQEYERLLTSYPP